MLTDLLLAIAHHLLAFALLGILIVEMMLVKPGLQGSGVRYLARIDAAFGIAAGLLLIVGFSRVFFGLKGASYNLTNWIFWMKIAAVAGVGLLSILPTMNIVRWRRAAVADPAFVPDAGEMLTVRRFMHYEGMVFFTIPVFAALMARGYGG